MIVKDFLSLYQNDGIIQSVSGQIHFTLSPENFHLKGLSGSLDAVILSGLAQENYCYLVICSDKEEAYYLLNDLQAINGEDKILLYPASQKQPFEWEDLDNANVLMRAEILNILNNFSDQKIFIITYPEALPEKVLNKKSLVKNTFSLEVGQSLDLAFLSEVLNEWEFERTDFVYEAGQYSVRGGIIDIFSYAAEYPYRIDLFGNEIESIRTFNPETQLSLKSVSSLHIIPNIENKIFTESRESFFHFLPKNTLIYIKDYATSNAALDDFSEKLAEYYNQKLKSGGDITIFGKPEEKWETKRQIQHHYKKLNLVEFGRKSNIKNAVSISFFSKNPGSFKKDFNRLAEALLDNQSHHYTNFICSDSPRQLERLEVIFNEINSSIKFTPIQMSLAEGFIDDQLKIAFYPDHQIFEKFFRYKEKNKFSKNKALTLKELRSLQVGDFVTHVDHGIGRFAGLTKVQTAHGEDQEVLRLVYRDNDLLSVSIHSLHKISKYAGKEGELPNISKLGSPEWENKKSKVKKQVKDIAKELIQLYAKRKEAPGFAYSPDTYLQAELESSFFYEDTPDQAKSTADVKADMEKPHPMDRLVCGDVGFGKTEVAIRAAFKAVADSKQVAVLVPTTVLAMQHFRTFHERLAEFPCKVEYINRFKSSKKINETLKRVESGETDILIGTHRIVNKDVKFKDLGLLIIDEEQKFGVRVKDKLKEFKVGVDCLTLTATPIPRTLHFSLMGARDLSVIATPPPNRLPVDTKLIVLSDELLRDAIHEELKRGGQVFVVNNRIANLESIANQILRLVPDAKVGVAHGQMEGEKLENIMIRFMEGDYDVLVATNIIESGLDVPNANTIFIMNAHQFGLSDLHQMRGRVGRSNKKAYCYLVVPSLTTMTSDAKKRLSALEEFSDLGDGIKVAMRDLDIRGAGNLLGAEQSGFINDLGFEMYHKILDEAVQELKENEFKALFEESIREKAEKLTVDCTIETDLRAIIPENYISSINERLSIYTQLDELETEEALKDLLENIQDRFGKIPEELHDLVELVRCRWKAQGLLVEKILLKNTILKLYFVNKTNPSTGESPLKIEKIVAFVNNKKGKTQLREKGNQLILQVEGISTIENIHGVLDELFAH